MKNLESITGGSLEGYLWLVIFGGNGVAITGMKHAFRVERSTPPMEEPAPRNAWTKTMREWWTPWNVPVLDVEQILTPICGRLKSKSRQPYFGDGRWGWRTPAVNCRECREELEKLGTQAEMLVDMNRNDPWYLLSREEQRRAGSDPVSGL